MWKILFNLSTILSNTAKIKKEMSDGRRKVSWGDKHDKTIWRTIKFIDLTKSIINEKNELTRKIKVLEDEKAPLLVILSDNVNEKLSHDLIESVLKNFSKVLTES